MSASGMLAALPARIGAIPRAWAARTPDAPALIDRGRVTTYGELARDIDAAASWLRGLGVRGGDRVLVVGENCAALVKLLFAITDLDAWASIVNARLAPREIEQIAGHAAPRRILYLGDVSPDAARHAATAAAEIMDAPGLGPLAVGSLNESATPEPVCTENDRQTAVLIYTSGTTGRPKGVMLSHRSLLFIAETSRGLRRLLPGDRVYAVLPLSHIFGLASLCLGTLHAGASLFLVPRFSPEAALASLRGDGITMIFGVPAMFARLVDMIKGGADIAGQRLRFIYAGGAPLDVSLKREAETVFGCTVHNGYGMTETSPTISATRLDAPRQDDSVGRVIDGLEHRLRRPDGSVAAQGEVGELWVRGPNVMLGYYRDPELTRTVIDAEGWLDTGDLAREGDDGALFIAGRSKELIIRSGFNVYPVEVEGVLNSHPGILHSAVVGRSVPGNEEVVAFVEAAPGAALDLGELMAFAAARLSPYKRPAEIVVLPALPAAATGKILKNQLKILAQERQAARH